MSIDPRAAKFRWEYTSCCPIRGSGAWPSRQTTGPRVTPTRNSGKCLVGESEMHLPSFQSFAHSLLKRPGCTPVVLYPEAHSRGANLELARIRPVRRPAPKLTTSPFRPFRELFSPLPRTYLQLPGPRPLRAHV